MDIFTSPLSPTPPTVTQLSDGRAVFDFSEIKEPTHIYTVWSQFCWIKSSFSHNQHFAALIYMISHGVVDYDSLTIKSYILCLTQVTLSSPGEYELVSSTGKVTGGTNYFKHSFPATIICSPPPVLDSNFWSSNHVFFVSFSSHI